MNNQKHTEKVILFNDIVGSTKLWGKYGNRMFAEINRITQIVNVLLKSYNSFIIKTIGDSFMIAFNDIIDSIDFAIKLEKKLENTKSKLGKGVRIHFRTGIYYGDVKERKMIIQKCIVKDFFGNVVNIASRLESKVCETDEIVFGFKNNSTLNNILDFLKNKNYSYTVIEYKHICNKKTFKKKIYNNKTLKHKCKNIKLLKGLDNDISVLKIHKKQ